MSGDLPVVRLSTRDWSERDRIEAVREIVGNTIMRHRIEPLPGDGYEFDVTLRALPGLRIVQGVACRFQAVRTPEPIGNDDLYLNVSVGGAHLVRQRGREVVVTNGSAAILTGAEPEGDM
jgi:AraC-binding-like domain